MQISFWNSAQPLNSGGELDGPMESALSGSPRCACPRSPTITSTYAAGKDPDNRQHYNIVHGIPREPRVDCYYAELMIAIREIYASPARGH